VRQRLGRCLLRLVGWRIAGELPSHGTYVAIAAPHTSDWDLPLGLLAAAAFGVKISWLGKDALFRWPFGRLMRWLGGIPVHRDRSEGVVQQAAEALAAADSLVLAITPEGTRSPTAFWRSGFYHIATAAGVPIFPVYIDRPTRHIGAGPAIHPSGDLHRDMDLIRDFYAGRQGIRSANAGAIRLREEN
jgi:1-acyl-sn-glycerol-3-phosphate acyltransferase